MDEEMSFSLPPILSDEKDELEESTPRPQPRRLVSTETWSGRTDSGRHFSSATLIIVLQGSKRRALEENSTSSTSSSPNNKPSKGHSLPLKARYGVNAWKRWALSFSDKSEDTKAAENTKPGKVPVMRMQGSLLFEDINHVCWQSSLVVLISLSTT